jgi:hypothetical protein
MGDFKMAEAAKPALQSDPGESFLTWAFSTVDRLKKAIGLGAILATAWSIKHLEPYKWIGASLDELRTLAQLHMRDRASLAFVQAAACLVLALVTPRPSIAPIARRSSWPDADLATAATACRRIQLFLVATYFQWALYYVITGLSLLHQYDLFDRVISLTVNTLQGLLLFWLYLELAELTIDEPPKAITTGTKSQHDYGEAAFHRVLSIGVFALIVGPAWYAFGTKSGDLVTIVDIASSCLNGVSLALVVGRLGSKNIDPGPVPLGLLYFYAVIQPMAAAFPENPAVHLLATTVALPLKVLLWLVCVWAFTTGILAEYVRGIRALLIAGSLQSQPVD